MATDRMPGWTEDCQSQVLEGPEHSYISLRTVGKSIVEGCIRLRSQHDLRIRHGHLIPGVEMPLRSFEWQSNQPVSSAAGAGSRSVRFWDNMGAALVKGAIFGD